MSLRDTLDTLLADIGPLCDPYLVQAHPEDNNWHLVFDEDTELWLELMPAQGSLVLSAEIGTPGPGDRKALYEILLLYGFAWHVNGGLSVALDDADGGLHLMQHLGASDLSADQLAQHLTTFIARLRTWQELVAQPLAALADHLQGKALLDFAIGRV